MFEDPDADPEYQNGPPYPTWFWYGQFEGANRWYLAPNAGPLAQALYAAGNLFGRLVGHPRRRILK